MTFSGKDNLLQRSQWAINMPSPTPASLRTVQNWLKNRGSINKKETAFLEGGTLSLLNIGYFKDASMIRITTAIEPMMQWFYKKTSSDVEADSDTTRVPNPLVRAIARTLAAIFTIAVLLVPAIILNVVQTVALRFVVVFIATALFIGSVTAISQATMSEIFVAGATYAAVLVVFIASNGSGGVSSNTGA